LGNKNKVINSYYGLTPWLVSSKIEHGNLLVSLTENIYDHRGRVLKVYQTIDANPKVLIASNQYNELGQLVEKNIHSTNDGNSFMQSIDYRYNIRGWLTHINNSALSNDILHNDDSNDLFGMELKYNTGITVGTDEIIPQYNGNVSSMSWKTNNLVDPSPVEKVYGFKYDALNRLTDSKYATGGSGTWNTNVGQFNEDNISYDRNGNIMHLERRSIINEVNEVIDQLNYSYNGNQVTNVMDDSPYDNPSVKGIDFGFTEIIQSAGITEYQYDNNGYLVEDDNKGILSVQYNHLNFPTRIELEPKDGSSRIIEYVYSAGGDLLTKSAKVGSQIVSRTDYVAGVQYKDGQILSLTIPEGRAIKENSTWQNEYHIKDHLGNVRVAYGMLQDVSSYKATMETELSTKENADFPNLTPSMRSIAYNHTKPSGSVSSPNESVRLNGFNGSSVGPAKMLQVSNGDRIEIGVYVYCPVSVNSNSLVPGIATAVTGAFSLLNVAEASYHALNGQVPITSGLVGRTTNLPKAYLCYLLFNKDYEFIQHGFHSVDNTAKIGFQELALDVTIPTDGYIYVYVANETYIDASTSAYFDDLSIVHHKNSSSLQVVQSKDYYPFGLEIAAVSYQKESISPNDRTLSEKEVQKEFDLNWINFGPRMYMADLGRWTAPDPYADKYEMSSPYSYTFNNPLLFIDPTGKENIIYLITDEANLSRAISVAKFANAFYQGLQLNTTVVVVLETKDLKFDPSNMDANDNWAVIGTNRKKIAERAKELTTENKYYHELDDWISESGEPEVSASNGEVDKNRGIVIDYNDGFSKTYPDVAAAITLMHGAAHSSSEIEKTKGLERLLSGKWVENRGHTTSGISAPGNNLRYAVMWEIKNGDFSVILKASVNEEFIKGTQERYGTEKAKDNYWKNAMKNYYGQSVK
ncbi:MAG: hypothetical protein DI539_25820, partial [Flavobacterium psychrophilum]